MKKPLTFLLTVTPLLSLVFAGIFFFRPSFIVRLLEELSPGVLYSFNTQQKLVALTIDDGPDGEWTPKLLDLLKQHQVKATFFIIGSRITGNEALLRQMLAEGHELGNHLAEEEPSIALSMEEFERKLVETDQAISEYGSTIWFRPGSGWYSPRMLRIIREHGYTVVMGSVFPFDTYYHAPDFAGWYILTHVHPGAIIVLHDYGDRTEQTLEVLQTVIPELQREGYVFVTLSELNQVIQGD